MFYDMEMLKLESLLLFLDPLAHVTIDDNLE